VILGKHERCEDCGILLGPDHLEETGYLHQGKRVCETCRNWLTRPVRPRRKRDRGICPKCGRITFEHVIDLEMFCLCCGWRPTVDGQRERITKAFHMGLRMH